MKIVGKVIQVLPMAQGVSKQGAEWKKASVIIETGGNYPHKVKISNFRKADEFAALKVGITYEFDIDIESREHNGSWFTDVSSWAWSEQASAAQPQAPAPAPNIPV